MNALGWSRGEIIEGRPQWRSLVCYTCMGTRIKNKRSILTGKVVSRLCVPNHCVFFQGEHCY